MKQFKFLIIIFIFQVSCKQEQQVNLRPVKHDTSISKHGSDVLEGLPIISSKLNLSRISDGVDSFECRFWLPQQMSDTINILEIKYTGKGWNQTLTTFFADLPNHEFRRGDTTNYFLQPNIRFANTSVISPDINIKLIVDSLAYFDLQNSLPNIEIEKGQEISSGDTRYILEFADKKNYRALHYLKADRDSGETEFDKTMEQFLTFIKRHYKIKI